MDDLAEELDDLYARPLEDFTATRDDIVARLRSAGLETEAEEVRSRRKPTVSAWVVNQLARRSGSTMAELLDLRGEVERADSLKQSRKVMARRRSLIAELLRDAGTILEGAGKKASSETNHRIANSLLAASTGLVAAEIRSGRLERDVVPSGFETGIFETDEVTPEEAARDAARTKAERLAHAAEEAEAQARRREAAAARAESEAQRSRELATHLRATADKARERAEAARAKADGALAKLDG